MRGETKAHLLQTGRQWHVTKFNHSPAHRRLLINEFVGSALLHHLGIATPAVALVQIGRSFPARDLARVGVTRKNFESTSCLNFGSEYPGDPERDAVYDFLPESLAIRVDNKEDFKGVLAFDKWTTNLDQRQAVYTRMLSANHDDAMALHKQPSRMRALMIDNGNIFGGASWQFSTSAILGIHPVKTVYRDVKSLGCFEPWLDHIVNFSEEVLRAIVASIPNEWLAGEERNFEHVVRGLLRRRGQVPDLINQALTSGLLDCNK